MAKKKIVVVGPVYPYKGGIAHYTGLMVKTLRKNNEVTCVSYKMQYPKLLFKKEQKDFSNDTFKVEDTKFLINTANPFNIVKVGSYIKKLKPDLVIFQWWHPYFAPCYFILLGMLKRIKSIAVCHNILPHERFPMDKFLIRTILKKTGGCIVHSKEDEKNLKAMLPDKKCVRTVLPTYNAFKMRGISRDEAREELGISKDRKMLLFFGLVRPYKGLTYLLSAMPEIIKKYPDILLYIVGDFGDSKEEYDKQIGRLGIADNLVIKAGYLPDKEVEPYYAAADINVCPYESATQSAIVQVAYGFGIPVLATNVGGLPDVVSDGKTGYIVEPKNPKAIAGAVVDFYENNRINEMASSILAQEKRFSWDRMSDCVEKLYQII